MSIIILLDLQGDIIFLSNKDISILIKNISVINFPPLVKGGGEGGFESCFQCKIPLNPPFSKGDFNGIVIYGYIPRLNVHVLSEAVAVRERNEARRDKCDLKF